MAFNSYSSLNSFNNGYALFLDQGFYENHVFIPNIDITHGIFNFAYNERGNLTLLSTTEEDLSILDIPSSVNGTLVDSIGPAAFYNTPSIQLIKFRYIEENAFIVMDLNLLNFLKV